MIYIEYEAYKSKYYDTQKQYNDILRENQNKVKRRKKKNYFL